MGDVRGPDWAGARGRQWLEQLDPMEATLAPVDPALVAALALDAPCRIAEIGCGGGAFARGLAAAAPAGSEITGFDISPDLIATARERGGGTRFVCADAATFRPEHPFDRLVSRFGVMFFVDPAAAFAHLRHWLAPDGRIAFAVWGPGPEVGLMASVRAALASVLSLPPPMPDAPGPCRYGDPAPLLALLAGAGFIAPAMAEWRGELPIGGGMDAPQAADFLLASASTAALLADAPAAVRGAAREALIADCARHLRGGAVWMPARVHLVTARG